MSDNNFYTTSENDSTIDSSSSESSSFSTSSTTTTPSSSSSSISINTNQQSKYKYNNEGKKPTTCSNNFVFYMLIFFTIFLIILSVIFLFVLIFMKKNNNIELRNGEISIPMGLKYKYLEIEEDENESIINIVEGTLYLESDKLIGKDYQEFSSDDDNEGRKRIYIHSLEKSIDGSSAHDCTAECVCENGKMNRRIVAVYPIFQTIMGFSVAFALSVFAKNAVEQCNYYLSSKEEAGAGSKCNVDESTVDCEERKPIEWDCEGNCIYVLWKSGGTRSYPKVVNKIIAKTSEEAKAVAKSFLRNNCVEFGLQQEFFPDKSNVDEVLTIYIEKCYC